MDKKGKVSDVVYPNLMFCVDNFEEVGRGDQRNTIISVESLVAAHEANLLIIAIHFGRKHNLKSCH